MKKKMKTNQDGGSVTASDPAAAGKEMAANQTKAAGPAQTKADKKRGRQRAKDAKGRAKQTNKELGITGKEARIRVRKAKVGSKATGALAAGDDKKADRLLAKDEKLGEKLRNTPSREERNAQQARKAADEQAGPGRMGYSQKFGPGRMNGYDAGAKKVMDVMSYGGASKYMAEGPAQGANQEIVATGQQDKYKREVKANRKRKFDAMNERLRINKDEARTDKAITKQRDITSMQADVKDGTRPGFSNPSVNPIDGMTYSYGARLLKGGDAMINPASSDERNITRGADGYYTADAFPRNRRSARSREEFTGTYGRDRGNSETPNIRGSFDYAKSQYERNAQRKATQRNRMIDDFKTKVGIDVNRERMAAANNTIAAAFNRGIGSVKNSTFKNPTGLKSYETKEIN